MKKRLLALLLTAFVLCTMAVNAFALTTDGQGTDPYAIRYTQLASCVPQNEAGGAYKSVYTQKTCAYCGKLISEYTLEIPLDFINNLTSYPINNGLGSIAYKCALVSGSYWTYNRFGYKPSDYNVAEIRETCNFDPNEDLKGWVIISDRYERNGVHYVKLATHYRMYNGSVQGGYFTALLKDGENNFASIAYRNAVNWRTSYESNNNDELYVGRKTDFCIVNFATGESTLLDTPYITDQAYNSGFDAGVTSNADEQYDVGYQDGYKAGFGRGQNESNFDFTKLFDGMFGGFAQFLQPVLNIGIGNITIASMIALVGLVFVTLLIIKIIRGA